MQSSLLQASLEAIERAFRERLKSLDLSGFSLSFIPKEIKHLSYLESLKVSSKKLIEIPKEIKHLKSLKSLDLSSNQIQIIPTEIGQLKNLQFLNLSSNQIQAIPAEIGQLKNLQFLNLSSNQIQAIPTEIGGLIKLESLKLNKNNLDVLPKEMSNLVRMQNMTYGSNPFSGLPPEIRLKGWVGIIDFFRQKAEGTDHIYEAKLLILGEGGAGKTSLAKKVKNENYDLDSQENSTKGIDIIQWLFPYKDNKEFQVNIWDFGGQEIYHSTHQFFLTKRSLYILVADNRKEDTDFYYWLNIVNLLSESSPIVIIQNEKQDRQREISERQLRGEFLNLKDVLATNLSTNRGLEIIKKAIQQYITCLPHVGAELPLTWVKVRGALESNPQNHITLEEYLNLCQDNSPDNFERKWRGKLSSD